MMPLTIVDGTALPNMAAHVLNVVQSRTDKILIHCLLSSGGVSREYSALVDTGAERSAVSGRVVEQMGLACCGDGTVLDWRGEVSVRFYCVDICVLPRLVFQNMTVDLFSTADVDVLVGMDVLSRIDFSYSFVDGRPVFKMCFPHSSEPIT